MKLSVELIAPVIAALLAASAWLPMTWQQQLAFGAVVVVASPLVSGLSAGHRTTHFLMLLSVCAIGRNTG
jgi:hypothetical protein